MSNMYLVNENALSGIANAIRSKSGKTDKLTVSQMADEIENLNVGGDVAVKPLTVKDNGVYQEEDVAYSPVTVDFPEQSTNGFISMNSNPDGSWKKPDEYPDIGQIQLQENEVYYLCKNHLGARFWGIRVYYTGTLLFERGHMEGNQFVSDKVYTGTVASTNYLGCMFDDDMPEYIVIHVKASTQLQQIPISSLNTAAILNATRFIDGNLTPAAYSRWVNNYEPILWRRANLPYAIAIGINCYYIEKDEVVNLHNKSTSNFSLASIYNSAYNLVETHIDGKLANYVTACNSMFSTCYSLSKIDINLADIVTSKCTTVANMFQNCYSLRELDVTGWDASNVTTATYTFAALRRITKIVGLENLRFPKVNSFTSTFAESWNLRQDDGTLDISNWFVGKTALPTTTASMFAGLRSVKVLNIDGINLSACTTIGSMFANMYRLEEIQGKITAPSTKLTSSGGSAFNGCYSLRALPDLSGWDFSKTADISSMFSSLWSLCELDTAGIIFPTVSSKFDTMFRYGYRMIKIDVSNLDLQYTATNYANMFANLPELIDFYPPKNIGAGNRPLTFSGSYSLSHDSLIRILNNLATVTTATTLTLGKVNLDILTEEEKAIATSKGWTLA